MEKRYFWFKMEDDFFQKKEIKKLRSIAGGDTYVIIYLKIILLSLKNGGKLYFEGIDESFIAEIALEIDENKDNVGITLEFLMKHSAVIQTEENEFKVNDIVKSIGSETATAIRVRKHREKFKLLQCNKDVTPLKQNDNGEIEIEIEIESEIEIYRNKYFAVNNIQHDIYLKAYPDIKIIPEYNKMESWLESNPKKRKSDYPRFINNWLGKAQKEFNNNESEEDIPEWINDHCRPSKSL